MKKTKTIPIRRQWLPVFTTVILPLILNAHTITPFWQEDFGAGLLPVGWTTSDLAPTPITWGFCMEEDKCPLDELASINLFPNERFQSFSMENGYAYLFPDAQGSAIENHESILQTDVIDCGGKDQVFVAFNTFIIAQTTDPDTAAVLEVKAGTGNWERFTIFPFLTKDTVEYAQFFGAGAEARIQSFNGQHVLVDISSIASKQSEVQIRWVWRYRGPENYCWLIDDIELLDENPMDENAIWGTLPGQGDFNGGLNGWKTPNFGACNWAWSATGLVDYPDAPEENMDADAFGCSATMSNGVALMNAACISSANEIASCVALVSPVIDLSGVSSGKRIGVRFNQSGATGNNKNSDLPLMSLMVSIDGGATHIDTVFLNLTEPFKKPFCKNSLVPLPAEAIGAEELVIKFVFAGTTHFWMIDDVRIVELYDYDLRISEDYFAVPPNFSTPSCLIRPIPFAAEVQNVGNLQQDFIILSIKIIDEGTGETAFTDSLFLGSLVHGERSEEMIFEKKFTPAPNTAYIGYYTVKGDGDDGRPADNKVSFRFNTIGNTVSKNNTFYSINGGFAPLSNFEVRYEIGNVFFIPPNAGVSAPSMEFALSGSRFLFENDEGKAVEFEVNLYRWKSGSNYADANGDFLANVGEFDKIADAKYVLQGGLRSFDVVTVPLPDAIPLEDSTYYFVTVKYNMQVRYNGQLVPFFISSSEEVNYAAMYDQSVTCGLPSYNTVLKVGFEQDFKINPWGLLRTPFINLNVEKTVDVAVVEALAPALRIYPNPSSKEIKVDILDENNHGEIAFEIYDICGRSVLPRQIERGYVSHLPIDVSPLANGIYNLHVISGEKIFNGKFVKLD